MANQLKGYPNEWGWRLSSIAAGTRPPALTNNAAGSGTSVTPGTNTFGTAVTLISGASLVNDVWEWEFSLNSINVAATARNTVARILIDPAGGTAWSTVVDLFCGSPTGAFTVGSVFRFPHRIKAGSSIGVQLSCNSATLTAGSARMRVWGQPSRPDLVRSGGTITAFGNVLATSEGTSIVEGTTSEGAWTDLGALAAPCWFWNIGPGVNSATFSQSNMHLDLAIGDATTKKLVLENVAFFTNSSEDTYKAYGEQWGPGLGLAGDHVYARAQSSAAAYTTGLFTIAAYGVGG